MKILRLTALLPVLITTAMAYGQSLPKPVFSIQAGYYADSVRLVISSPESGAQIRYTINGEEPTPASALYTAPLVLKNRSHAKNTISSIPTNPSFSYPKNGYDYARAQSRGWLPPYDTCFKATVVKARLFKNGYRSDSSTVATYLIREHTAAMYSLPVLSISLDSASLFSYDAGIYVYGADSAGSGNYSRDTAYRKAYVEFFETGGALAFGQYVNLRIHGNGGRHAPQKSLLLKAEKEFGKGNINYPVFAESSEKKFDKLLLRNAGHRPDCVPRDDIGLDFLASLNNLSQRNRHCIVLINGEYWGIQTLKDVFDDNYFNRRYHIPKELLVLLMQTGTLDEGEPGDEKPYTDLLNFFASNNLANAANYEYVASQMDVESFTDFQCGEIFLGNGDWPNNNTKFWRYKTAPSGRSTYNHLDGRWRWLFYDFDAAFGGDCSGIYPSFNALTRATDAAYANYTRPLRALLSNPEYTIYFINRYADLLNSNFLSSRLMTSINKTSAVMGPEMQEHVERWRYPAVATTLQNRALETPSTVKWNSIQSDLLTFASQRAEKTRRQFMAYFGLQDTVKMILDVNDTLMGKININSLSLDPWLIRRTAHVYPWSGIYFSGNPVSLEAVSYPGYRFSHWNSPTDTLARIRQNITANTSMTAHFKVDTDFKAEHYLYINELLASNMANVTDDYLQQEDWIELYNPQEVSVDVAGFYISDDPQNKTKYRLKTAGKQTIIAPHGFLLIWADDDPQQGCLHTDFKLNKDGGYVLLTLPDGLRTVDSIAFKDQKADVSYGRREDGNPEWVLFDSPTPNASNHLPEVPEPETFIVFPNPVSSQLFFTRTEDVTVYDVLGKQVLSAQKVKEVNVTSLSAGMYFLKTGNGHSAKFIRQ